jgi:ribosome-binding factor A
MADHKARVRRLADQIKFVVAEMLERRIKDPRLGFVTITDVRLTNDMHEASVFYTVMGDDKEREDTAAALASAKGLIRSQVGQSTGVRFTPSLEFIPDGVPANAAHIEDLLKQAATSDASVNAKAADAEYAGEADPYRAEVDGVDAPSEDDADALSEAPGEAGSSSEGVHDDTSDAKPSTSGSDES